VADRIQSRTVLLVVALVTVLNVSLLWRQASTWIASGSGFAATPPAPNPMLQDASAQRTDAPQPRFFGSASDAPPPPGQPQEPGGPSALSAGPMEDPAYSETSFEDVLHDLATALSSGRVHLDGEERGRVLKALSGAEAGYRKRSAMRDEALAVLYVTLRANQWAAIQRMRGQLTEWAYLDLPGLSTHLPEPGEDRAVTALRELLRKRVGRGDLPPSGSLMAPPEDVELREAMRALLRLPQDPDLDFDARQAAVLLALADRAAEIIRHDFEARMALLEALSPGTRAAVDQMRRADYTAPQAVARTSPAEVARILR